MSEFHFFLPMVLFNLGIIYSINEKMKAQRVDQIIDSSIASEWQS